MLINLNQLKTGLYKSQVFRLETDRLLEQPGRFLTPVEADLTAYNADDMILVTGRVKTLIELSCSRCLTEFSQQIDAELNFTVSLGSDENYDQDEEVIAFGSGIIDIDSLVTAAIILELPLIPLCNQDCQGLCSICGANGNEVRCNCKEQEIDPRLEKLKHLL